MSQKTDMVTTPQLPEVSETAERQTPPGDTDWQKAFVVLAKVVASGFISTNQYQLYINAVQHHCGEEPAQLMASIFNSGRSKFMQGFMG